MEPVPLPKRKLWKRFGLTGTTGALLSVARSAAPNLSSILAADAKSLGDSEPCRMPSQASASHLLTACLLSFSSCSLRTAICFLHVAPDTPTMNLLKGPAVAVSPEQEKETLFMHC